MRFLLTFSLLLACISPQIYAASQSASSVTFLLSGVPAQLKQVLVYGDHAPLNWEQGLPMQALGRGHFALTIFVPASDTPLLEYKFRSADTWESIAGNRLFFLGERSSTTRDTWSEWQPLDEASVPKLSVDTVRKDMELLADALRTLHPGLYRYMNVQQFDALLSQAKAAVDQPVSHRDAYMHVTRLVAAVRCGHTHTNPWNQGKLIKALVYEQEDRLPLTVRWLNERLWVQHALTSSGLQRGDEILAINQLDTTSLLERLLTMVSADGRNLADRMSRLQQNVTAKPQWFDILLPAVVPPEDGRYRITIRRPNGEQKTLELRGVSAEQRYMQLLQQGVEAHKDFDESWAYRILPDGTGYLRLGTFSTYKMKMDWRAFIDNAFEQFNRHSRGLIVDIRGNGGGMPEVSHYLTRWISEQPVTFNPYVQKVVYQKVPQRLRPYLGTWDKRVFDLTGQVSPAEGRFFKRNQREDAVVLQPKAKAYKGEVVLLVDGANSSATFTLAREWQRHSLATLVGEPTGGSLQGINGGVMFFMTLPGSGVEVDIPLIGYFPPSPQKDLGIMPDVRVSLDPLKWVTEEDQVLMAAAKVLKLAAE